MGSPSETGSDGSRGCVLLTGANGFTGQHVRAELIGAGYSVCSAVVGAARGPHEATLDITSRDNCRRVLERLRPDYLIHLAAISFVQHADADAFYRVNVIGTMNLLEAVADARLEPRRIVIASSANVYGNATGGVIDESFPPQPVNHYAVSKLAMEHMVKTFSDRFPIVLTRPFNYTGRGQQPHFLVPKIVSHFLQRAPVIELGNLDVERDFSDVRMVAHVYRRLLECDSAGETVNICSGRPYSLRTILDMMAAIAGYEIEVRVNPAFVRRTEVKTLVGSTVKLRALAGPLQPIGLHDTLQWMTRA
ncbi:GDP-mannose 4,6-dehydratase [Noviherbaspirillum aridicola]|uniref:UDP-glucose 4-epimerase n=1 Tax=Noviherbaspirillum aridicola TaxID=2849687 RepID=A0ABQ4Q2N9_9BURK|nr:GDP-mannose 4,6-dehydratase [Noviherbaspirillum aridicola]GIZ51019.1 UDP-glucose 4-epimerase [Noviherbaspirillum aridicola]